MLDFGRQAHIPLYMRVVALDVAATVHKHRKPRAALRREKRREAIIHPPMA